MRKNNHLEKVVRIINKRQEKNDFAYWQNQPVEKRLAALEEIRREYHRGTQQRFQRVYKIIKRV